MKQQYATVNSKLGNLETRMDTMSRDQVESSCAIQSKLNAILRNSTKQDNLLTNRTQGTESISWNHNGTNGSQHRYRYRGMRQAQHRGAKIIMESGTANTTSGPGDSTTNNNVGPDAMTWASAWEMMKKTLEAFATRNTDSSERGDGKSRKTLKKPKEFKDDSDGCIDTWVEVMRLHLEQDNLNDERSACTAILRSACTATKKVQR